MKIIKYSDEYYLSDEDDETDFYIDENPIDIDQVMDLNDYIISKLRHYCDYNGLSLLTNHTIDIIRLIKL